MNTLHCKTKYICQDVGFNTGNYSNGRLAITIHDADTFEPLAKVTVNAPEEVIEKDEIIVKNYSENEGMDEWLLEENLVEKDFRNVSVGFALCPVFKLTDKFRSILEL